MLFALSGLIDCPVEASDGEGGAVKDFLFDDQRAGDAQTHRQAGESADRGRPPRRRRRAGDKGYGGAPLRLLRLGSLLGRVAVWRLPSRAWGSAARRNRR